MKQLTITGNFTDDLGLKSVQIDFNETGMKSDSRLIKLFADCILRSVHSNKESCGVQDLLNELNIKRQ